jgi:hypothetical protein
LICHLAAALNYSPSILSLFVFVCLFFVLFSFSKSPLKSLLSSQLGLYEISFILFSVTAYRCTIYQLVTQMTSCVRTINSGIESCKRTIHTFEMKIDPIFSKNLSEQKHQYTKTTFKSFYQQRCPNFPEKKTKKYRNSEFEYPQFISPPHYFAKVESLLFYLYLFAILRAHRQF